MPRKPKANAKTAAASISLRSQVLSFSRELLLILFVVLVINSFVLASFEVPTGSMEDTVAIGDRLFVNKFIYGGSTPYAIPLTSIRIPHLRVPGLRSVARGDVIVFDWPGQRDEVEKPPQAYYVKRCVALPGDTLMIRNRLVYVNGEAAPVPPHVKYLRNEALPAGSANPYIFPRGSGFNEDNFGPIVIPYRGMRLALDAADFAAWEVFIRREGHSTGLVGTKVVIDGADTSRYTVQRDYVFGMGDNRDNSLDSRFWGFIPLEDVIGTPLLVYWSWSPSIPIYHLVDKVKSIDFGRIGTIIR